MLPLTLHCEWRLNCRSLVFLWTSLCSVQVYPAETGGKMVKLGQLVVDRQTAAEWQPTVRIHQQWQQPFYSCFPVQPGWAVPQNDKTHLRPTIITIPLSTPDHYSPFNADQSIFQATYIWCRISIPGGYPEPFYGTRWWNWRMGYI